MGIDYDAYDDCIQARPVKKPQAKQAPAQRKPAKGGGGKGGGGGGGNNNNNNNNNDKKGGKGGGGGKGGKKGGKLRMEGGSVWKQQFLNQREAEAKKKDLRATGKGGAHLGSVGVSQENKGLVLDVLRNIRDDVNEEVKGLDSGATTRVQAFQIVDGQLAKDVNALYRRGFPKTLAEEMVKALPKRTTAERLWPTTKRAMEMLAEEVSGALCDDGDHDPDALAQEREEELNGLEMVLDPGIVNAATDDGTVEVTLNPPLDRAHHKVHEGHLKVVFYGIKADTYPATAPQAVVTCSCDHSEHAEFIKAANKVVWNRLVTDLVGQPVLFECLTELENEIPRLLGIHHPPPVAETPPPQAGGKKGGKGGKRGKKGGGAQGYQSDPAYMKNPQSLSHSRLVNELMKEQHEEAADGQGGDAAASTVKSKRITKPATVKNHQFFTELSEFEVSGLSRAAAKESSDGGGRDWPGIDRDADVDERLKKRYEQRIAKKEGLPEQRARLPAAKFEAELVKTITSNQVTLVTGETGCGKTTQVPQFILDQLLRDGHGSTARMVCTQPRRIAATSIARRVASERGDPIGNQVGYSVRLDTKQSAETRLLFCTTGVLLRRMQADRDLSNVSHVIVDEVHERSLDSDFLLIFLKDLIARRSDVKIILMSASVNAALFCEYFANCPVIHIPGFTHPVEVFYLEDAVDMTHYVVESDSKYANKFAGAGDRWDDYDGDGDMGPSKKGKPITKQSAKLNDKRTAGLTDYYSKDGKGGVLKPRVFDTLMRMDDDVINPELVARLVAHVCTGERFKAESGAVLVFLPGMQEINQVYEEINSDRRLGRTIDCHRLHSSVSNAEQEAVFKPPRGGLRKVVLSTNIAETSVTIDDIVFVIDCGKHRENRYAAQQGMSRLVSTWVSQANAQQRKGRAGRVRPGFCFRLFSGYIHDKVMQSFQECEMTRVPLQNLLLQIRILHFGGATDSEVLARAIEAPSENSISACRGSLQDIGALGSEMRLTSLGLHLANLPMDPKLGKLLLHGVLLRCVDPCLTIAACLQAKSPFVCPYDQKTEADLARAGFAKKSRSDHIANLNAYNAWFARKHAADSGRGAEREFCSKKFLSGAALTQIQQTKRQYYNLLQDHGFLPKKDDAPFRTTDHEAEVVVFEFGGKEYNRYSTVHQAVKGCLTAAFTPSVVRVKYSKNKTNSRPFFNEQEKDVWIHPSSVAGFENQFPHPLLVYYEKMQTTKVYLRDVTMVSPQMLMLFAVDLEHSNDTVLINKWISFGMDHEVLAVISELRKEMQRMLATLMDGPDSKMQTKHANVVAAIVKLLKEERTGGL